MSDDGTLTGVLAAHAAGHGDRVALTFVADLALAPSGVTLTYREWDTAARRLARWLGERYEVGDRALLMYPDGLEFAVALAGCLYAGIVAVPVPKVDATAAGREQAARVAQDAEAAVVLTDATGQRSVTAWLASPGAPALDHVATDAIELPDAAGWSPPPTTRRSLAMVQYTSGSTSKPRGVVLDHHCILAQVAMSRRVMAVDAGDRFGGWLPLYHDLGLMSQLLQPLVLGASSVLMPPFEFIKRPVRWLQLIDRHDLNISLAPNFAYDLCRRRITDAQVAELDLSRWEIAGIGAETVQAATLAAFGERFAPAGFRPEALTVGYGLAEATVYTSVGARKEAPAVVTIDPSGLERGAFLPVADGRPGLARVSCGRPCEIEARIVDPQSTQPLPAGQVGEIWLRGPAVARGYRRADADTARTFQAATATGEGGFLRTGDLGALHDGELFVTGRLKETLIIRGRNLYPQDIEHEVATWHDALAAGAGAVFSDGSAAEQVVVVHECQARPTGDEDLLATLVTLVRERLFERFGVTAGGVLLVRPGTIPRTSSGKVQRLAVRQRFLAGALPALNRDPGGG